VPQDRLRKYTEANQELARSLIKEMQRVAQLSKPVKPQASKGGAPRKGGASGRGSEERYSTPALAGKKRGRDLDTEKVCRMHHHSPPPRAFPYLVFHILNTDHFHHYTTPFLFIQHYLSLNFLIINRSPACVNKCRTGICPPCLR
jgi:hypothetical protein